MVSSREKSNEKPAIKYLNKLQENYPELFSGPSQESMLTEKDIETIGKELRYSLPKPYAGFLRSCQLPGVLHVPVFFCGDYASCYEPAQEDDSFVTLEMDWHTDSCGSAEEFLSSVRARDIHLGESGHSFLDAGLLKIAEFEGYFVFLDLVTGKVVHIYHEAIYDMCIVDGIDASDYQQVRSYLSSHPLCKNFDDFLRLVCTKEIYNEDCMKFKTAGQIKKERSNYQMPSVEEQNEVREKAIEQVMARENMSREEAIQYLADLVQITVEDFKKGIVIPS